MCEITRPCVLPVPEGSHFPVQNLPFGTFRRRSSNTAPRTGVRIGDNVLDMACLADAGCFQGRQVDGTCFHQVTSCSAPAGAGFAQAPWRSARGGLGMQVKSNSSRHTVRTGEHQRLSRARAPRLAPGTWRAAPNGMTQHNPHSQQASAAGSENSVSSPLGVVRSDTYKSCCRCAAGCRNS